MKLIAVSVGRPRTVSANGKAVTTGIFKQPVSGRVRVRRLNLDGDAQADLNAHGGPDKAVYAYPAEHYDFWRAELPGVELPWGMFGENLTTEGLREDEVCIGDRFRIGSAEFVVRQPRIPCYKLALKFERPDMVKRFLASRRTGFYLAVAEEGEVEAGDAIELLSRDPHQVPVSEVTRVYAFDKDDQETIRRLAELEALSASWRDYFRNKGEILPG